MTDQLIGKTIGNYVLRARLGEGGMGAVYEADHRFLGTRAAIKVLHGSFSNDPALSKRFFQEAKSTLEIKHPNVIQILDFGQSEDGSLYLVMELLEGRTLAQLIAEGPFGEASTVRIGISLCEALMAAHAKNIVHRDLKPDNIFLVGDHVKVLDFGIAKVMSSSSATKTGSVFGTPHYMAPEQARGSKHVTPRTDIYSLGAIFYEMLTGRPPFTGDELPELITKHMFEVPEKPSTLRAISSGMDAVILHCLQKEPDKRPADMGALRDLLLKVKPLTRTMPLKKSKKHKHDKEKQGSNKALPPENPDARPTVSAAGSELLGAQAPVTSERRGRRTVWVGLGVGVLALVGAVIGLRPNSSSKEGSAGSAAVTSAPQTRPAGTPEAKPDPAADRALEVVAPKPAARAEIATPPSVVDMVELRLKLTPPDATVEIDGVVTRENPLRVPRSETIHKLVIRASGYAPETRELHSNVSGDVVVVLTSQNSTVKPQAPHPATPPPMTPRKKNLGPVESEL